MWVGGTLTALRPDRLELKESFGSVVTLRRLGSGATVFFEIEDGIWKPADARAARVQLRACVETLMSGKILLALRVFLGADCGPAA